MQHSGLKQRWDGTFYQLASDGNGTLVELPATAPTIKLTRYVLDHEWIRDSADALANGREFRITRPVMCRHLDGTRGCRVCTPIGIE
jgi:hypothetical protein